MAVSISQSALMVEAVDNFDVVIEGKEKTIEWRRPCTVT
jgi:hypothetical protein